MSSANDLKVVLNSYPRAINISELMYDQDRQVEVYFQSAVLVTKYFLFHPNENHATLRITTNDRVHKLMSGCIMRFTIRSFLVVVEITGLLR